MNKNNFSMNWESGFSLFETIIASGIVIFTLAISINCLIGLARARHIVADKAAASIALDNFIASLRAASGYDDKLRSDLIQGTFPTVFKLKGNEPGKYFECSAQNDPFNAETLHFACRRNDGEFVMRTYIAAETAPGPGVVLTPAPTDIIRLPVSTATLEP